MVYKLNNFDKIQFDEINFNEINFDDIYLIKFILMKFILIKVILFEPNFIPNYPSLSLAQLSPSLFLFFFANV